MVRKNHHTEAHTDVTEPLPHELPTTPKISTAAASHQLNGSTKFLEQSRCIPTARPNSSINRQMPLSNRVAILIDHWRRDIHMQYPADKQHIPALCLSQWVHKHFQVCKTGPWRKKRRRSNTGGCSNNTGYSLDSSGRLILLYTIRCLPSAWTVTSYSHCVNDKLPCKWPWLNTTHKMVIMSAWWMGCNLSLLGGFFWQHDPAVIHTTNIIKSRIIASASRTWFFFNLFGIYEAPTQTIDGRHEGNNRWGAQGNKHLQYL